MTGWRLSSARLVVQRSGQARELRLLRRFRGLVLL